MSYEVNLTALAQQQIAALMATGDTDGLRAVADALDRLADNSHLGAPWGPHHRRLRVGRYRIAYHHADNALVVLVIQVGRTE